MSKWGEILVQVWQWCHCRAGSGWPRWLAASLRPENYKIWQLPVSCCCSGTIQAGWLTRHRSWPWHAMGERKYVRPSLPSTVTHQSSFLSFEKHFEYNHSQWTSITDSIRWVTQVFWFSCLYQLLYKCVKKMVNDMYTLFWNNTV